MKRTLLEMIIVFFLFLAGTAGVLMVDTVCLETTGQGGKLVLDVDNWGGFQKNNAYISHYERQR